MRVAASSYFLASRTLKNRILFSIRRLKRPRYLLSAIVSIAYFAMVFGRNRVFTSFRHWTPDPSMSDIAAVFGSVAAFVILLFPWTFPSSKAGLEFTEPEIQFLFPAPFSRRELMLYKLIRNAPALLLSTLVFTLFGRGGVTFFGMLVVTIATDMYMTFVRCARARLKLAGIGWLLRMAAVIAVTSLVGYLLYNQVVGLDWAIPQGGYRGATAFKAMAVQFGGILASFPLAIFFAVPRMLAITATSHDLLNVLSFGAMTAAFAIASFYLGSSLDIDFEEASIEASRRKAERMLKQQSGRRGQRILFRRLPAPFRLAEQGNPAVAIFWKNLIAAGRVYAAQMLIMGVILIGIFIFATLTHPGSGTRSFALVLGIISLVFVGALFLLGPSMFRNDLRSDLEKIEILRAFPINGFSIVAAEVAAPAVLTFVMQFFFALLSGLLLFTASQKIPLQWIGVIVTATLLLGPPLTVLQLLIHNAWALMLPGWSLVSKDQARGFAATGQGILIIFGQLLILSITLLPAAIGFGISMLVLKLFNVSDQTLFAGALVIPAAILVVESWTIMQWLGHKFEDLDLANDDLAPKG
jgi:hypothetical protein